MPARSDAAERGIPDRRQVGSPGRCWRSPRTCARKGSPSAPRRSSTRSRCLSTWPWGEQQDFKQAIAATLAKSPDDRRLFELVFDRFFFRAAEAEAARRNITEAGRNGEGEAEINLEMLRQQIAAALRDGSDGAMRDLARLAIAAFGEGQGSGVLGVDVQRIRRALGLGSSPSRSRPRTTPAATAPRASSCASSSSIYAASSNGPDRADARCRPSGRSASSTVRCRRVRSRISRRSIAWSPNSSAGSPPRATNSRGDSATRTSTSGGRCALRSRPAACRSR